MPSPSPLASGDGSAKKPHLMKRNSSQSSHKYGALSPGSAGEWQPLRHHVKTSAKPRVKHAPKNHGSGRNLVKLARQIQQQEERKNARKASFEDHSGDTEIRLPGSLDENRPSALRRNLTASQLPQFPSHTKLKKNLSHGHLTRLGSGKNLAGLNATAAKGPPSPGLKGRSKRSKSTELSNIEHDMQAQETEAAHRQDGPKKVGFAVGSSGDDDEEDAPQMEGSGLQDDEWTDQSGSASPYSTRQNTANNSRRPSITADKPPDKRAALGKAPIHQAKAVQHETAEAKDFATENNNAASTDSDESGDDDQPPSPRSLPKVRKPDSEQSAQSQQQPTEPKAPQRSPLHGAKEHPNPAFRNLLSRSHQHPAPALVSNVSAMDDAHSARGSPAASMRSSRSNIGAVDGAMETEQDELVSRFVPSASHPSSAGTTAMNTPKMGSFQTSEGSSMLDDQRHDKSKKNPTSPGSTHSGASSGAATPRVQRSRTEERMLHEKTLADLEDAAARNPIVPPHVFDRRNESLKSYLNLAALGGNGRGGLSAKTGLSLGPEIFQGRFKAVNTELKVVQRFRDPLAESASRLNQCKGTRFAQLRNQKILPQKQAAKVPISKSAVSLPKQSSKLSSSTSPPRSASPAKPAITSAKSATQIKGTDSRRGKVTFSQTPAEVRDAQRREDETSADAIARQMWDELSA